MLDVEIPANTTAKIYIPSSGADAITENNKPVASQKEIKIIGKQGEYVVVETGSGKYSFSTATPALSK